MNRTGTFPSAHAILAGLTFALLASACRTPSAPEWSLGPGYRPKNVHGAQERLPADLRRVAVLPLVFLTRDPSAESAREMLEGVLRAELGKASAFETLPVSESLLRQWTGQTRWSAEEKLPTDFFERIRKELDCQAVLFPVVTHYRAYPPVAIGWRVKLVDAAHYQVLWSVDEVFDGAETPVANSAQRYFVSRRLAPGPLGDAASVLGSPNRFAQYTVDALADTLPKR